MRSSRMLKKSSSGVLTSLRGSTYRSVRLASSLTAALLEGLLNILCTILIRPVTSKRSKVIEC